MYKFEIEDSLRRAVSDAVPDNKDIIIDKCREAKGRKEFVATPYPINRMKRRLRVFEIVAAVAVLMLVFNITSNVIKTHKQNEVETIIDIDVNPSIELRINSEDRVVKVIAVNADAREILDGMKLEGAQTKVAINAIVGSMVNHGYFEEERPILVSVESKNKGTLAKKKKTVVSDINEIVDTYSVNATVISQTFEIDDNSDKMVDKFDISQGKAALIARIREIDESQAEDELALMSISELADLLISLEDDIKTENMDHVIVVDIDKHDEPQGDKSTPVEDDKDNNTNDDDKKYEQNDSVSDNSISDNSISDNSISDNSISENSISDNEVDEESESNSSVSDNSASKKEAAASKMKVNEDDN